MIIDRTALPEFLRIVESGKIAIVIGARQVGKTTLVSEALKKQKMPLRFYLRLTA